jgi:hypothetical protein
MTVLVATPLWHSSLVMWDGEERKALRLAINVAGSLSIVGNLIMLHGVLRKPLRSWTTYHRVVLAMSLVDLVVSFWYVLADLPVPVAQGGQGTVGTCVAQGFMEQLGIAVPLLNATLATNYLLVLYLNWSVERVVRAEPVLFGVVALVALVVAVIPIPLDLYNVSVAWCWIQAYPFGCDHDGVGATCQRGNNSLMWQLLLFYGPVWVTIAYTVVVLAVVLRKVVESDGRVSQLVVEGKRYDATKKMARQVLMFMLALTLTWAPVTVHRIYTACTGEPSFFWTMLGTVCVSLQGFFNMLAYMHPRCARVREESGRVGCYATLRFLFSLDDQLDVRYRASSPAASAPSDNNANKERDRVGVRGAGSSASCFKATTMETLPRFASSRSERAMVHAASDGSASNSDVGPNKAGDPHGLLVGPASPGPAEPEPPRELVTLSIV